MAAFPGYTYSGGFAVDEERVRSGLESRQLAFSRATRDSPGRGDAGYLLSLLDAILTDREQRQTLVVLENNITHRMHMSKKAGLKYHERKWRR